LPAEGVPFEADRLVPDGRALEVQRGRVVAVGELVDAAGLEEAGQVAVGAAEAGVRAEVPVVVGVVGVVEDVQGVQLGLEGAQGDVGELGCALLHGVVGGAPQGGGERRGEVACQPFPQDRPGGGGVGGDRGAPPGAGWASHAAYMRSRHATQMTGVVRAWSTVGPSGMRGTWVVVASGGGEVAHWSGTIQRVTGMWCQTRTGTSESLVVRSAVRVRSPWVKTAPVS